MNVTTRGRRGSSKHLSLASRVLRRMRVTLGLSTDARSETIRATTLAGLVAASFAFLGSVGHNPLSDWLADAPFNADIALRALSHGWFESNRTVPVTIVDIDADTQRGWGNPPTTPRDQLLRLLEVVAAAKPSAVVVDIDLSGSSVDAGSSALHDYLAGYAGLPLIVFPKRVETASDGTYRPADSAFDEVVAGNPRLAWAHANFETGGGGAVRSWQRWLAICTAQGTQWLPSVTMSLALDATNPLPGLDRAVPPAASQQLCGVDDPTLGQSQRLLIGPRLTGDSRPAPRPDAQAIAAALLLDPEVARDDTRLFGGRVVFIGATHPGAGDVWATPGGVVPGVELLANTVRYAPLQVERSGWPAHVGYRCVALLLFAVFVIAEWYFRGFGAVAVVTLGVLTIVASLLALFDSLVIFDALEAAILLSIVYKALEVLCRSVEEYKARRPRYPQGFGGLLRTLFAPWLREHKSGGQGD